MFSSAADAQLGADLPIAPMFKDEQIYTSLDAIVAGSTAIVAGSVTSVDSLGTPNTLDDPHASEYFLVTVAVETVVKGDPTLTQASFAWEGFLTKNGPKKGSRTREKRLVQDGVSMPDAGDRLLLFLAPEDPVRSQLFSGKASFQVNTLDGIMYVDNGIVLTQLYGKGRPSHGLSRRTLEEVIAAISGTISPVTTVAVTTVAVTTVAVTTVAVTTVAVTTVPVTTVPVTTVPVTTTT